MEVNVVCLGYVSINTLLPSPSKTFRMAGYSDERMLSVAKSNLQALKEILLWNIEHHITVFRITSNLIPFGSSDINSGTWKHELKGDFEEIGKIIRKGKIRVSMHPGQYTVLNTPNNLTLHNTLKDLEYHNTILELMGVDSQSIILVHGGGAYGDKVKSLDLLIKRIGELPLPIRKRLALENDERVFTAQEILMVCKETKIPGVFDVFHHKVLPSFQDISIRDIIMRFSKTWHGKRQKIHYSDQAPDRPKGAHSQSVNLQEFLNFYNGIKDLELDIMLEVKDKQTSLLLLREHIPELR